MKPLRILVVGGLAAGPSAAAKAARTNPQAEVTLLEQSDSISYGICETPYVIGGEIDDERRLVLFTPEQLREKKGVNVKTGVRMEEIRPTKRIAIVRDLNSGGFSEYPFDKLILATGSSSRKLGVKGEDGRNVFHLKHRDDTLQIIRYLETEKPKQAVIIGGGYIGMEMAEALRRRGMDVVILHRRRLPLGGLEEEARERIVEELDRNEVIFVTNATVEAMLQDKTSRVVRVLTNKGSYECDFVLVAIGVEPNVQLAQAARVRLGTTGAIITDLRQQTNIEGVYAAGDCCEVKNLVSGKPMFVPLATIAARQGWVAGENAAGGRATFAGAIRAMAVRVFDLEVAQVGLSSEESRSAGFDPVAHSITAHSKIALMPGSKKLTIRMLIDRPSRRVLGANLFGSEGVALRANTLGVAIQHKLTVDDVARLDLIYAPPFAPLWDPILVAANEGKKTLGGQNR